MMFIIIQSISEGWEGKNTFRLFDLALDGEYFCSLRYSQLFQLQNEIQKTFPATELPPFPPKKILGLDDTQLEERRFALEKYLQALTLAAKISRSDLFKNFFLAAQFASWEGGESEIQLTVHLLNGKNVTVKASALDRADVIQVRVAKEMGLPDEFVFHFALHLCTEEESNNSIKVYRRVYDFESPVILTSRAKGKQKILLMRRFWHTSVHDDLKGDKTARNLLFLEGVHGIENRWWKCKEEDKKAIEKAIQKSQKKEFLDIVCKQNDYLFVRIDNLTLDFQPDKYVGYLHIGKDEVRIFYKNLPDDTDYVSKEMKISRIRCWKMSYARETQTLVLALHYLVSKGKMEWVYITGEQVAFAAQCVQGLVHETVRIAQKINIRKPSIADRGSIPSFPKVNRRELARPQRPPPSPSKPIPKPDRELSASSDGQVAGETKDKEVSTNGKTESEEVDGRTLGKSNEDGRRSAENPQKAKLPERPDFLDPVDIGAEAVESKRSITNVLKKLSGSKSNEVSNDLFDQVYGDDDL